MKDYYKDMTPEQIAEKKKQFKEMGDAWKYISLQDRAAMIIHFMQMKMQWDTMSDEDKELKKQEMKEQWKEFLPLSPEEKKQKTIAIKEIKLRPNIDVHDYQVKMRSVQKFLSEGDKVKVTLRFRGREMAHQDRGASLLQKVKEEIDQIAKVEMDPKFEGRQMIMVLAPR